MNNQEPRRKKVIRSLSVSRFLNNVVINPLRKIRILNQLRQRVRDIGSQ